MQDLIVLTASKAVRYAFEETGIEFEDLSNGYSCSSIIVDGDLIETIIEENDFTYVETSQIVQIKGQSGGDTMIWKS